MKKVTLLMVMLAFIANISMAQNKERVNAFNYSKNAQGYINTAEQLNKQNRVEKAQKQMGFAKMELTKAKAAIDLAAENEETKNDPHNSPCHIGAQMKIKSSNECGIA